MRKILFRGKNTNKLWVYGFVYINHTLGKTIIVDNKMWNNIVIPETVGQFIGLTDKNGKEVFEGDIVSKFGDGQDLIEIEFNDAIYWMGESVLSEYCEVVGNIHDNPELMK